MELSVQPNHPHPEFLAGGGEMGERIRGFNWSETSLGPVSTWPQSLRTCVRIMLSSRQPIWIGWGKDLIKLYNDPYQAIVGGKHPWALGKPASAVWSEIWKDIGPMLKRVMENDEGTYVESQLLIMERNGYPEETYYTFSYTPIPGGDGSTEGVICFNTDDTDRIISGRQLLTLTQLGKNLTDTRSNAEVIDNTIGTLTANGHDFPFAFFYSLENGKAVFKKATAPIEAIGSVPLQLDLTVRTTLTNTLQSALEQKKPQVFNELISSVGELPRGAWEIAPDKAVVLPIISNGVADPYGFLVVALNPYLLLDDKYEGFFSLVADQVATSFASVHALEEERKRAEALAELDRAKTTFFSNISHEFRTPLTLLLGPVSDALNDPDTVGRNRARLEVALRNVIRMQKLVNTLLEFSRIEAGRTDGHFTKVNIIALTADLASGFRSAIEKAGIEFRFEAGDITDDIYVDVDMWEKIVLNLLSNALKYSLRGVIAVSVSQHDRQLQLSVADTGVGIPANQLDKIFDRFHRVQGVEGRSLEGTGIGLSLVKELVRIHHGAITVSSEPGKGSVFTVALPVGGGHLPADRIAEGQSDGRGEHSDAYLQEALKWLQEDTSAAAETSSDAERPTVLLADDNADMREYVRRLLSEKFTVATAVDGQDAWDKIISRPPDLLLSDVMMPRLDGFALLKKLRNDTVTQQIPVILLSARAGEEAKVEGMDAGADDYLVKPFSARELMARVEANIKISISRRRVSQLLAEEVQKRTNELRELNVSLQQSNNDLQQFAHVASHDLKEPLRKIKTFLGRLGADPGTQLSEKSKTYFSKVDSAADRLFTMVEGVLNYSMVNASHQQNSRIDLNEIFSNIQSDLELQFSAKSAHMHYRDLPVVEGAAVLIYQLFYNLINNSLKFSRAGVHSEIHITAAVQEKDGEPFAEIRISDNGIGFEQGQSEQIFNTFARLHSKDQYEGTGLGLALCKRIVYRHRGTITAMGITGQGATFIVTLPLRQSANIL